MTTLHLYDFQPLLPMLGDKLSTNQRSRTAFCGNFEQIQTLDSSTTNFSYPRDVKISYQMGVVFVSDFGNHRIQLFDLFTKKFLNSIELEESPQCLAIDEDDFDNLVLTLSFTKVCKLRVWLQSDGIRYSKVWERGEKAKNFRQVREELNLDGIDMALDPLGDDSLQPSPTSSPEASTLNFYYPIGISVRNQRAYVCDSGHHRIVVLSSVDGSLLSTISSFSSPIKPLPGIILSKPLFETVELHEPWMIDFTLEGELIVSEYWDGSVKILRETSPGSEWELSCTFTPDFFVNDDAVNSSDLFGICPLGICVDKSRVNKLRPERILVSHPLKNRILHFEWNSSGLVCPQKDNRLELCGSYGSFGPLYCPFGLTVDEWTGQLLIADENNHHVKIFK